MQRIRLTVRYDGTDFAGSQEQPGQRTVAGTLKAGLESLLGQPVKLVFASRTDSGVHAEGNVCAFDASLPFPVDRLPELVARRMPEDLLVREAQRCEPDFHPRFDARLRRYEYRLWLGGDTPVWRRRYYAEVYASELDWGAIEAGMRQLRGRHPFFAFSTSDLPLEQSWCELGCSVERRGREAVFTFAANRFLRHMVVRLTGALLQMGEGRLPVERLSAALDGDRDFQLRPAPAKGLTLIAVEY